MAVLRRLEDTKLFLKEDIQKYNFVGLLCLDTAGFFFWDDRFKFLIRRDPTPLSMPCYPAVPEDSWKPIHWSAAGSNTGLESFRSVLMAGLKHYPQFLGYCFTEGIRKYKLPPPDGMREEEDIKGYNDAEDGRISQSKGTPYELACTNFGRDVTTELFFDCVAAAVPTGITGPLLLSAAMKSAIHLDGLYLLLRRDPSEALSTMEQQLRLNHTISSAAIAEADDYDRTV